MSARAMGGIVGLLPSWVWRAGFVVYCCGFNTIVGVPASAYCLVKSMRQPTAEQSGQWRSWGGMWALSAIPFVGPPIAFSLDERNLHQDLS